MKAIHNFVSFLMILMIGFSLISCNGLPFSGANSQKISYAETVFEVRLPGTLNPEESLLMEVLDEVTGIALNPERFKMETTDGVLYNLRLPLAVGSVIRYRYVKNAQNNIIEKDTNGNQISYRLYRVSDASIVRDTIVNWDQNKYPGTTGEISGYIYNEKTDAPLPEIMVVINGMRTFTSFDGFFMFKNVSLGEYLLTAIHPDGKFDVFQQNAIIAENSVTPASFGMTPSKMVDITFLVSVPKDTNNNAVVRLIGNLYSLGNSFAELNGGSSVYASRSPQLKTKSDGRYEITLQLPAGSDLRYKYTLGNGFINAEHDSEKKFITRQLIVPEKNSTISDTVSTWYSQGSFPVNFEITTPNNTPVNDSVAIQLNPYMWLEPIPMWKTGPNQWGYTLYGPFEYLTKSEYRFCRNNQCGIADDEITHGMSSAGYQLLNPGNSPITIPYQINQWFGLQPGQYAIQPADFPETNTFFMKGYQFDRNYNPEWLPFLESGMINMGVSGANWIFFSPSWSFSADNNFPAGLFAGKDIYSSDILKIKEIANNAGLSMAVFPQINPDGSDENYWLSSNLSYNWWQNWFNEYERFMINYVDFSELHGVNTVIIGGKNVSPAFTNGILPNGNSSNTPLDFKDRWSGLIEKIRSRFNGQIGAALPYTPDAENLPEFVSQCDFIYLEMDSAITASNSPSIDDMANQFSTILDRDIYKLYAVYQKPLILGINYFAVDGSASNCSNLNTSCANLENPSVDVAEQADVYQAILKSSISRPWIYGIVSAGFNPTAAVQDGSPSVYGKPAFDVLSYYFNQMK